MAPPPKERIFGSRIRVRHVRDEVTKGWTVVYVARATSYRAGRPKYGENLSVLGNPFQMGGEDGWNREEVLCMYRGWLENPNAIHRGTATNAKVNAALDDLARRLIAGEKLELRCFCHPRACHAGIIREEVLNRAIGTIGESSIDLAEHVRELGRVLRHTLLRLDAQNRVDKPRIKFRAETIAREQADLILEEYYGNQTQETELFVETSERDGDASGT